MDHNKLWKILKETGIPDHLAYLLRNLYAGQEATVKTGHGLAIINSAVMNIGVHVSLSILVSSVCMLSSGIAGSSDQISRSAVSDSLQPHESQHARPPSPSPTPGVHSDSCPSSQ